MPLPEFMLFDADRLGLPVLTTGKILKPELPYYYFNRTNNATCSLKYVEEFFSI
jgi:hypothetical protein